MDLRDKFLRQNSNLQKAALNILLKEQNATNSCHVQVLSDLVTGSSTTQNEASNSVESVDFKNLFDICESLFGPADDQVEQPKSLDTQMDNTTRKDFAEKFVSALKSNVENYKSFFKFALAPVLGNTRLQKFGANLHEDQQKYTHVISESDEAFVCLLLHDRWVLWRKISIQRVNKLYFKASLEILQSGEEEDEDRDAQIAQMKKEIDNYSPKNEDDMREKCIDGFRRGVNVTVFSHYGQCARGRKGFNAGESLRQLNEYNEKFGSWRDDEVDVDDEGNETDNEGLFTDMRDWWGNIQKGPVKRNRVDFEMDDDVVDEYVSSRTKRIMGV